MRTLSDVLPLLSADQLAELQAWVVRDRFREDRDLASVLASWAVHVQRFEDELDKTLDDHTVWIEYDWQAAQYVRDGVAFALDGAPERLRLIAQPTLAAIDAQFERISQVDEAGLRKRMFNPDDTSDGWWWGRLPVRGPVVDALLERPEPAPEAGPAQEPSGGCHLMTRGEDPDGEDWWWSRVPRTGPLADPERPAPGAPG